MKRGIPNAVMGLDNRCKKVNPNLLPSTEEAIQQYDGVISQPCSFGIDPLQQYTAKKTIRYDSFCSKYSFKMLFCEVSNGCDSTFISALKYLIDITYRLAYSSC